MKKVLVGFSMTGIVLFLAIFAFMPSISDVPVIDFKNYYGTAGIPEWKAVLADEPELQELFSWSIFHDVDVSESHAAIRHPGDIPLYEECMSGENTIMGFVNPRNNHCIEVMKATLEEDGQQVDHFLVRVLKQTKDKFIEITAFSDDWEYLWEVEEYLIDDGYMQIWP